MKVNSKARIKITHSARGMSSVEKTWAALGFEWFGATNPQLPVILQQLHSTGKAEIADATGTLYFTALDPMYVE